MEGGSGFRVEGRRISLRPKPTYTPNPGQELASDPIQRAVKGESMSGSS